VLFFTPAILHFLPRVNVEASFDMIAFLEGPDKTEEVIMIELQVNFVLWMECGVV
jgi:hypothetical protein